MASGAGKGESIPEPAPLMIMLKPPLATARLPEVGVVLCVVIHAAGGSDGAARLRADERIGERIASERGSAAV
jgi:hypothetical protein